MSDMILVTGGSGFIATHTIVHLLESGYRVRATVRSEEKGEVLRRVVGEAAGGASIETAMADLLEDDGWPAAMTGCEGLFHMASPFPSGSPDDEHDLIRPALEGTRRVLGAAASAGVPRAVLTSSVAAVAYGTPPRPDGVFTEADWTDTEADIPAYTKSKTLAERAAWDLASETEGAPALSVVNPSLVFGPLIEDRFGTSVSMIQSMITGHMKQVPARAFGVVDVRDVAKAHLLAYETDAAKGERFIASADWMEMREVADALREAFPDRADHIPTDVQDGEIERRAPSHDKASRVLGMDFVSGRDAAIATARGLIERGLV